MYQIEHLREKLYKAIETGITSDILKVSQELDKLILLYTQQHINTAIKKRTA